MLLDLLETEISITIKRFYIGNPTSVKDTFCKSPADIDIKKSVDFKKMFCHIMDGASSSVDNHSTCWIHEDYS